MLLVPRARKWVAPSLLVVLTGLVAAFLLSPSLLAKVGATTRLFGSSATHVTGYSDLARSILADQAWRDFYYSPFHGIGLQVSFDAQTVYLQILQSGGILLMATLMFYYFSGVWVSFRMIRENSLAAALCASVVASLVLDVFEADLTDRFYYVPIGAILALQIVVRANARDDAEAAEPHEPPAVPVPRPRSPVGAER
jgi:hypothetical protein